MNQKEIIRISKEKKVPKTTIDKDWVLGHFLNAMFSYEEIKQNFVFKGGTFLSKCHVENYRFSEDLDFTLIDPDFIIDKTLINSIIKIASKNSGAKFHLHQLKKQNHKNIPQGYNIIIKFWGADHKPRQPVLPVSRWQTKIELDISFTEKIIFGIENRNIFHNYSDKHIFDGALVSCYSINEILTEKIRALMQRNRPRDCYDIWFLCKKHPDLDLKIIREAFYRKVESKNLKFNGIEDLVNQKKENANKRHWKKSIEHQISSDNLPDFEDVYQYLKILIKKFFND